MDWDVAAGEFQQFLLTRGATPASASGYKWHTKVFWDWCLLRETDPYQAAPAAAEAFIAGQLATLSASTAYNRLMSLRAWFGYVRACGLRDADPTVDLRVRKPTRQPVHPFSVKEMQRLLGACELVRDRAVVLLLADTGMRIGELVGLKCQDVNWKDGTLSVMGKGRKERWLSVGGETLEALRVVANGRRSGSLWLARTGNPLTAQQCRKNIVSIAAKAGVARTYPHRFRSTFANMFLEAGGDLAALQSVLGHSDLQTTSFYAGFTRAQRGLDQMRRLNLGGQLASNI